MTLVIIGLVCIAIAGAILGWLVHECNKADGGGL